ncbi:ChbG/HpnK family deacetylase [Photobacterium kagoshimensis]|uniref:ChbG/HpnK family deacetylase n=1 Tax=Photobacterium kagoshimensis TaxID=2910242 RepID=UPI003D0ABE4B
MKKGIILCADDFGMSDSVNHAIIELIELGRLSATSCMTTMPNWQSAAHLLKNNQCSQAAIGLHFNLTEGEHGQPLNRLIVQSLSGKMNTDHIVMTFRQQLDAFEDALGYAPTFVDGHQHVHAFPGIRTAIMTELQQRYGDNQPWVRDPITPLTGHDSLLKAIIIRTLQLGFHRSLNKHTHTNSSFAGLYSLTPEADFPAMMVQWLSQLSHGGLIMCHPASETSQDEHAQARIREYQYLASDQFGDTLDQLNINLVNHPSDTATPHKG